MPPPRNCVGMTTSIPRPTSPARCGTFSSLPALFRGEESPPSGASRRAVDLTALDTLVEFKGRIGTTPGGEPDPENVRQLHDYLAQSASQGRVRMGILTDGKRWLLRWPRAGEVRLTRPYAFTLDRPDGWYLLAQLRVLVRRVLRRHGYPTDKQEQATQTVFEQAEVLSEGWAFA